MANSRKPKVRRYQRPTISSGSTVSPSRRQSSPSVRRSARRTPSARRRSPANLATRTRRSFSPIREPHTPSLKQQQDAAMKIQSGIRSALAIRRGNEMAELERLESKIRNKNFGKEMVLLGDNNTPDSIIAQSSSTPDKGLIIEHENPDYSGVILNPTTMSKTNQSPDKHYLGIENPDNINYKFFTVKDDGLGHKRTEAMPPTASPRTKEVKSNATPAINPKVRKAVSDQRTTINIQSSPNPTRAKNIKTLQDNIIHSSENSFMSPPIRIRPKLTHQQEITKEWAETLRRQRSARGNWDLAKNVIKAANAFQNRGKKGAGEQQTGGGTKKKKRRRSRKRRSRKRRTKRRR